MKLFHTNSFNTASSTVTSIIWRKFCEFGGQKCFLPSPPGHIWDLESPKDVNYINKGKPFDVWTHHVKFNDKLLKVVPNASLYFSIVRNPSLRFISAWKWYQLSTKLPYPLRNLPLVKCIQYMKSSSIFQFIFIRIFEYSFKYRTGLNSMSEELCGFRHSDNHYAFLKSFEILINNVRASKMILLVSDRFDESMLLLSYIFGWSLNQILYIPQKVQSGSFRRVDPGTKRDDGVSMARAGAERKKGVRGERSGNFNIAVCECENQTHTQSSHLESLPYIDGVSTVDLSYLESIQNFDSMLFQTANEMLDLYISQVGSSKFYSELKQYRKGLVGLGILCSDLLRSNESGLLSQSTNGNEENRNINKYNWNRNRNRNTDNHQCCQHQHQHQHQHQNSRLALMPPSPPAILSQAITIPNPTTTTTKNNKNKQYFLSNTRYIKFQNQIQKAITLKNKNEIEELMGFCRSAIQDNNETIRMAMATANGESFYQIRPKNYPNLSFLFS